jgi:hypothetical protein
LNAKLLPGRILGLENSIRAEIEPVAGGECERMLFVGRGGEESCRDTASFRVCVKTARL